MHVNVLGRARQALAPEYAGHSTPELNATECNALNEPQRNDERHQMGFIG